MINVLIHNGINVPTTPLYEQCDGSVAQVVFDDATCEAGDIRRISAVGNSLDRMAGEVVDDREIGPVHAVETQNSDLRINRSDFGNFFIEGH